MSKAKRVFAVLAVSTALWALATATAFAGSPHFVGAPTLSQSGDTLTVSGKIAGLGNETQVHVVLRADVQCFNRGGNHPQAENKEVTIAEGDFPVQNGKALFTLSGTGTTDPDCAPPMELRFSNVSVSDDEHGLVFNF